MNECVMTGLDMVVSFLAAALSVGGVDMNECVMTRLDMVVSFLAVALSVGMLLVGLAAGVAIKWLINLLRR